jgi:hypothetical protein
MTARICSFGIRKIKISLLEFGVEQDLTEITEIKLCAVPKNKLSIALWIYSNTGIETQWYLIDKLNTHIIDLRTSYRFPEASHTN